MKDIDIDKELDDALESSAKAKTKSASIKGESRKAGKKSDDDKTDKKEKKQVELDGDPASPMNALLEKNPFKIPTVGERITGKVIQVETRAIYVDLGLLGTGVVFGKEIKDGFGVDRKKLGPGDEITAAVVDLENEDGYMELSISEAVREQAWGDLTSKMEEKELVPVRILDANKGGLMVEINGITGFMPVSQLTAEHYPRVEDGDKNKILEILKSYIETEMTVCVLDIDEEEDKLIVSEKEANRGKEKDAISELEVGKIVEGDVSGVVDFGAFVKFLPPSKKKSDSEEDKLEGLVHISQLDWQLIDDPRKVIKVGDRVQAKIIAIDDTRISLSIRELKNDPWASAQKKYKAGDKVIGTVSKINHFGAFVYLDKDIHGLAHVSSFPGYPEKAIDEVVKTEEKYEWEIMSLEPMEHRMGLKFVGKVGKKKEAGKTVEKEESKKEKKSEETLDKGQKTKVKAKAKKSTTKKTTAKKAVKKAVKKKTKKVVKKSVVKKAAKKAVKKTPAKKTPVKKTTKKKTKINPTSSRKSGTSKGSSSASARYSQADEEK